MKMNLSKKNDKTSKKRKKSSLSDHTHYALSTTTCNVTGLGSLGGGINDDVNGTNENELDCLEAMMMSTTSTRGAKNPSPPPPPPPPPQEFSSVDKHEESTLSPSTTSCPCSPNPPPPPPPGIHQIPNIRIELARHLQTQTLSTFLLKSCPGIRMPTFERWLLDSKLEESDRFHSIIVEWIHNPSLKMTFTESIMMKKKKKYGRAARYDESTGSKKDTTSSSFSSSSRRHERERARFDKDCKLVLEAEKRTTTLSLPRRQQHQQQSQQSHAANDVISNTILCNIDRDPILPSDVMETDPSCDRLIKEIIATMSSTNNDNTSATDLTQREENAKEIVRELCHRSAEACKELHHLERRLGKYQKFSWDCGTTTSGDSKQKRRGDGGGGGRSSIDKVLVEWHDDNQLCSLVYVPRKQKSSSRGTSRRSEGNNQHDDTSSNRTKPKPFVVKINSSHYHKLRKMFDSTYRSSETIFITNKDQTMTTAFHAVLFSLIIRYSALSGGQLLNDWRGGGMQGAVHDTVFDCLLKWFGGSGAEPAAASPTTSSGTECFASPFNSALSTYFSAFPSPDLDGHFGSYGDFFYPTASSPSSSNKDSIFLRPSWFELNPPFSPGVMMKMSHRIHELLDMQSNLDLDVTYAVIIPTVRSCTNHADVFSVHAAKDSTKKKRQKKHHASDDGHNNMNTTNLMTAVVNQAASQPFYQLTNSPYCKYHIILPPREHGYVEGSQHLRPTQFKESQYSTSVIVLRTKCSSSSSSSRGDTMRLGDDDKDTKESFESELRKAFASRHAMEAAQRKEGR